MPQLLKIALDACAATLLSALVSFLLIRYQSGLKLTAAPRKDRWHCCPTPNSGGVAIFLACAITYAIAFPGLYPAVALGAAAMSLLGFVDDRIELRPITKFAAQCAITAMVVSSGIVFPATPFHTANALLTFLWIVGIMNAFNLIDNMDGLCAGVVIVICAFRFGLLALDGYLPEAGLFAVIGAAYVGFLVFNYRPAKIFMGDCGSLFAGFSLAALTVASPVPNTRVFLAGVFYPALTFTYPIFDTLLVSVLRTATGRRICVGGRDHSSHRLAAVGIGECKVVWILWLLTALGSSIGLMVRWMPLQLMVAVGILFGALTMFGLFLGTLPPYGITKNAAMLPVPLSRLYKLTRPIRLAIVHTNTVMAGTSVRVGAFCAGMPAIVDTFHRNPRVLADAKDGAGSGRAHGFRDIRIVPDRKIAAGPPGMNLDSLRGIEPAPDSAVRIT